MHALIITGSVGAGKTRVLGAVTELLRHEDIAHVAVDMDALCDYWPWVESDPHNRVAGLEALRVICATARDRGIHRVVLAEVIEQPIDVPRHAEAVSATRTTVLRLVLAEHVVKDRLSKRDRDGDRTRELARARDLAELMERNDVGDVVVMNDGKAADAARDLLRVVG